MNLKLSQSQCDKFLPDFVKNIINKLCIPENWS